MKPTNSAGRHVLAFGTFDPLHPGHMDFLRQAKALGDYLLVVVACDGNIRAQKNYHPQQGENERLAAVAAVEYVDQAMLGNSSTHQYELLGELKFDILVLGYDQAPADEVVRDELAKRNKQYVEVIRLQPFHPEKYKSTLMR